MAFSKPVDKQCISWRIEPKSSRTAKNAKRAKIFNGFLSALRSLRGSMPDFEKAIFLRMLLFEKETPDGLL